MLAQKQLPAELAQADAKVTAQMLRERQAGPTAQMIGPALPGRDKWLGGELAADGCVYGVPGGAGYVLKIDPATDTVTMVGDLTCLDRSCAQKKGQFKWLRGALARSSGDMFCIPSNAKRVLKINAKGEVSTLPGPGGQPLEGHWKWHGGIIAANGNLYGCPCNAEQILKIMPSTGQVSLICGPFPGQNKWYGALVAADGCMYCIPNCASQVLKFDPKTETTELLGDLPGGNWKWHGAALGGDGNIYGVPAHATRVLKIVVATGEVKQIGPELPSTKYKWGGATRGPFGDVYCWPSDTERTLKISVRPGLADDEQVSLIGPEYPGKNKWQNGFTGRDNAVYGIPCDGESVLRISAEDEVTTIGGPWPGECKWEGGVQANNGVIYAMPQKSPYVLRIDPGPAATATVAAPDDIDELEPSLV